jgi:HEAT repeat protein
MATWCHSGLRDPRAFEPLLRALAQPDPYLRKLAAEALGELGDVRAIDPLVEALVSPGDGDDLDPLEVRRAAARALTKLGEVALGSLGKIEPSQGLGPMAESGDPRLLAPLSRALRAPGSSEVRADAAMALGRSGNARAVRPLIAATMDAAPEVRDRAFEALGELGADEGLDFLVGEAKQGSPSAVAGLGKLGDRGADAVIELIDHSQAWEDESYVLYRALAATGSERAFQRLLREVERDEPEAIWPLARTGDSRAVDVLIRRLSRHDPAGISDADGAAVANAAGALATLDDPRAVEPLIDVLASNREPPVNADDFYRADANRERVLIQAIKALGMLGDSHAIPELERLTNQQPDEVREEARWALQKLEPISETQREP